VRVLFDQGTPVPLRRALRNHAVSTAFEMGWAELGNGQLLEVAEAAFDVLITTDKNLRYQQDLSGRRLAILVLPTTSWPVIQSCVAEIIAAVDGLHAGEFLELRFSR
jgi:hypothetical protein